MVTSYDYIKEENGTLGGIGGQLINGSADITIPLSYLLPFRVKYVVALHPLIREPYELFKISKNNNNSIEI